MFIFCRNKVFKSTLDIVLKASRAESTIKKYENAVAAWTVWSRVYKVESSKPDHLHIARYLTYLYNESAPYSKIETAFYAIKWKLGCHPETVDNPCDRKFLHLLLNGFKRLLAKPVNRKEPITPAMLADIEKAFDTGELKGVRTCAMLLGCFAGFLRFNELAGLKFGDVELCDSHIKLFLEKSKTDQFREGAWVVIGATGKPTCPVSMLKRYMLLAKFNDMSYDDFCSVLYLSVNPDPHISLDQVQVRFHILGVGRYSKKLLRQ